MTKPKSFFLILILLVLAAFTISFIYSLKYVKTEPKTEPGISFPVEVKAGTGGFVGESPQ